MKIETICVCGAGTMGSGIAQVAAQNGFKTIQFDVGTDMLDKSRIAIEKNLNFLVDKGTLDDTMKENIMDNLIFTSNVEDCLGDVIIEAIVEKLDAKVNLINQLAKFNHPKTIFATNTSSLSVSHIVEQTTVADKVVGMHFFNPPYLMKLVEVIETQQVSPEVVQQIVEFSKAFGKAPVVCKDLPGFIVNRVARHYYLEAMRLVENKMATIDEVDLIMEASGFKMGPFKLMDMIGLDINYTASEMVYNGLGKPERLTPSAIQQQKVREGSLGRKTGEGFYQYKKN